MAKYIPEQHYLGVNRTQWENRENKIPLGFITPEGTDAAAKTRKSTVTDWADSYSHYNKTDGPGHCETIDNKAMPDFKVSKSIGRWSTKNVVWRIEDPRGFELEISSPNMAYLMANTTINHGTIKDDLIWARDGAQNYLIPNVGEVFEMFNTKPVALNIEDHIGDYIVLQNGESGVYLGRMYATEFSPDKKGAPFKSKGLYHIFGNTNSNFSRKSIKNAKVDKTKERKSLEEVEKSKNRKVDSWFDHAAIYTDERQNSKELMKSFSMIHKESVYSVPSFFKHKGNIFMTNRNQYYNLDLMRLVIEEESISVFKGEYEYKNRDNQWYRNNKSAITDLVPQVIINEVKYIFD